MNTMSILAAYLQQQMRWLRRQERQHRKQEEAQILQYLSNLSVHNSFDQNPTFSESTKQIHSTARSSKTASERRVDTEVKQKTAASQGDSTHWQLVRAIPEVFDYNPNPFFDVAEQLRDFETPEKAEARRKTLIRALRTHRPEEKMLAEAIAACDEANRCRLLCCPVCMRAMRRWACGQFAPFVAEAPETWSMVTLVAQRHRLDAGALHRFDPQQLFDAIRKAVKRYGPPGAIVFGAVDFCEDIIGTPSTGLVRRVWWPHLTVMSNISPNEWAHIRPHLKTYFDITAETKNPIHVQQIKKPYLDLMKPISYCIKSSYYSRFKNRFSKRSGDAPAKGSGKGKPQRMHGKMQAELACLMARWRRKDRLLLIGVKGVKKTLARSRCAAPKTAAKHIE